jgi:hypothetical protein
VLDPRDGACARRAAFLTLEDRGSFVMDDDLAIDALARRGWHVDEIPWRREASWCEYACVVVRSTWDYQHDPAAFLRVLETIEANTTLWNSVEVIRWNLRKTYLRELAARGVRIVPTTFGWGTAQKELRELQRASVLKPVLGANANDTFVVDGAQSESELIEIGNRFANREWMLQPFVGSVATEGEHSLFYFANRYSHAVVKRPKPGDFRVQEEHGGIISLQDAAAELRLAADAVMTAVGRQLLQARVDLVRLDDGSLAVMELELIEPSLYFRMDAGAAERFADVFESCQGTRDA